MSASAVIRKFGIGDVVQLNSGGPHMTVAMRTKPNSHIAVKTQWVSADGQMHEAWFHPFVLTVVKQADTDRFV